MTKSTILTFGGGDYVVDTGTYGHKPAVFIAPAKTRGEPGAKVPDGLKTPLNALEDGEIVLIFPTEERCQQVADAIVGIKD